MENWYVKAYRSVGLRLQGKQCRTLVFSGGGIYGRHSSLSLPLLRMLTTEPDICRGLFVIVWESFVATSEPRPAVTNTTEWRNGVPKSYSIRSPVSSRWPLRKETPLFCFPAPWQPRGATSLTSIVHHKKIGLPQSSRTTVGDRKDYPCIVYYIDIFLSHSTSFVRSPSPWRGATPNGRAHIKNKERVESNGVGVIHRARERRWTHLWTQFLNFLFSPLKISFFSSFVAVRGPRFPHTHSCKEKKKKKKKHVGVTSRITHSRAVTVAPSGAIRRRPLSSPSAHSFSSALTLFFSSRDSRRTLATISPKRSTSSHSHLFPS